MNRPTSQIYKRNKHQRKPQRNRLSESESDGSCVVCAQTIEVFAIGHCDHFVCFQCSTKMRLLCNENFCPVCRKDLKKVIFSNQKDNFLKLNALSLIQDKAHDINVYFVEKNIIAKFEKILEHRCPVCKDRPPDTKFEQLQNHLRKEHTLFYCEICLEHNNNFTSEFKVYSRKDLATHKRVGDADDFSHRGHPLCQFCDVRYVDDDTLFRHLRTDHYYCHICDGSENYEFYANYPELRIHFKEAHFLCEIGPCINEEFTNVFASEIDFKAHRASKHIEDKVQQKLERQIDLGFQYSKREQPHRNQGENSRGRGSSSNRGRGGGRRGDGRGGNRGRGGGRGFDRNRSSAFERDDDLKKAIELSKKEAENVVRSSPSIDERPSAPPEPNPPPINLNTDFPSLQQKSEEPSPTVAKKVVEDKTVPKPQNNTALMPSWNQKPSLTKPGLTEEEFPSLSQGGNTSIKPPWASQNNALPQWSQSKNDSQLKSQIKPKSQKSKTNRISSSEPKPKHNIADMDDFPSLEPMNNVLVGRGASKHFEGFSSTAEEHKSNVKMITDKTLFNEPQKPVLNTAFKSSMSDFPSLQSNNDSIKPPPGFSIKLPKNQRKNVITHPKQNTDRESVPKAVRVPPGFAAFPSQSNTNKVNNFSIKEDDFPSFPVKQKKKPLNFSSNSKTAGTTLSSIPVTPINQKGDDSVPHSQVNGKKKKKQKEFKSMNPDSDFPGLQSHKKTPFLVKPATSWNKEKSSTYEEPLPPGTKYSLANVFD